MQDFSKVPDDIREAAKKLLEEGKVDLVIGFEAGTVPLRSTPCFIRNKDDVKRLTWNAFCENNLARYLRKRPEGKIGIVAKGCDVRALVELIKEKQVPREKMVIIGVPCRGMIDRKRAEREVEGLQIREAVETEDRIILKGDGFEKALNKDEFLHQSCKVCSHPNPAMYDIPIGEPVKEEAPKGSSEVAEFESKPAAERWQYLSDEISRCIRCYACRDACPFCYCEECFVDSSQPQWIGKSINASDTMIFHLVRAFHMAGRCVDCGACQRACPMGIDIRKFLKKLDSDVKELYGYEAGMSLEELAPLTTFKEDDPQGFMIEP
ncbi:MAG: 4Fe-4S dicluster domain-containing protein [Dehalococcoidia bacterium]